MPVLHRRTHSPSRSIPTKKFSTPGDDPSRKRKPNTARTYVFRYRWSHIIDFWCHRHNWTGCHSHYLHNAFQALFKHPSTQLNLSDSAPSWITSPKQYRLFIVLVVVVICILISSLMHTLNTLPRQSKLVPILIKTPIRHDIHGLNQTRIASRRRIFNSTFQPKTTAPNYDGLRLNFLSEDGMSRVIHTSYSDYLYGDLGHIYTKDDYRNRSRGNDDQVEPYYAFDDDFIRSSALAAPKNHCKRTSWHRLFFPNCNDLHTLELTNGESKFLSYGSYRQVFQINQDIDEPLILKMNRFKLDFEYDKYEFIRMDALVMERLTSSPRIADIYGHCGASVLTEFLPIEIEENVVPYGYVNKSDLHDELQVQPMNTFTPSQKLDMALRMAEAIADLHGFKDGIIVHDDIQLCQYLFKADNMTMKLNDFNRAEIMLYDEFTGQYCPYLNGPGGGNWRAPEEYVDGPLTETIDVWSLGNNFYSLLTGLWVYPDDEDMNVLRNKIENGNFTSIDPRYKTHSFAEGKLVDIIERIWKFNPSERPSIFDVVQFLREAVDTDNKMSAL